MNLPGPAPDGPNIASKKTDYIRELEALQNETNRIAPDNHIPLSLPSFAEGVATAKRLASAGLETNGTPADWVALGDAMIFRPGLSTARLGSLKGAPVIAAIYLRPGGQKHETLICRLPDTSAHAVDIACGIYWRLLNRVPNVQVSISEGIATFLSVQNAALQWFPEANLRAAKTAAECAIRKPLELAERYAKEAEKELAETQQQLRSIQQELRVEQSLRQKFKRNANAPRRVNIFELAGFLVIAACIFALTFGVYAKLHDLFFNNAS